MNEKTKKLGQYPAFPNVAFDSEGCFTHWEDEGHFGMSKRFYAACKAMQGILSNSEAYKVIIEDADHQNKCFGEMIIKQSYQFADELLKQENE
jgi:hypothetical protein